MIIQERADKLIHLGDVEKITVDLLDKTIKRLPDFHQFGLLDFIIQASEDDNIFDGNIRKDVKIMLVKLKYVESIRPTSQKYILTQLGRAVKGSGGHYAYLESLAESLQEEKDHKKIEFLSNKSTAELNTYLYKTRWLPHILALIATIISIIALCYSVEA